MAGSGKVVYWETISSAATFAFINKDRSGVEGVVSGMSTGEKVIAITNAESAGFVLTFNTGRLAFLTVRDSHGRPAISVQFLQAGLAASSSGIFGSIRHALSHLSIRGDVTAVRADRSSRVGERNVVALTKKGRLQAWRLHRSGHYESLGDTDAREDIIGAIHEYDQASKEFPTESFEALDLTYVPQGLESKYLDLTRLSSAISKDDPYIQHVLMLASFTRRTTARYVLVELVLESGKCHVGMIRPLTSYATPAPVPSDPQAGRPRIYLPRPALVAYAVFDRAAVVASIAVPPESPESQLQSDSHILPPAFEDVVDFREDGHDVLGSGIEELPALTANHEENRTQRQRSKNPAVILLVRGAGTVRVITTDVDKLASDQPPKVSAKSKMEQAVFFGMKADNPLIFDARTETKFSREETAAAALEVSHEILSSSSPHLGALPPSMEDNLRARTKAMERLMNHLEAIDAKLDRRTRWSLLHNAEKMHVAVLMWRLHEDLTAARPSHDKTDIIKFIVDSINEEQKSNPSAQLGEVDPIRHWFINDVHTIQYLVAWAYELIKTFWKEKSLKDKFLDEAKLTVMMHEAVQINIRAHTGALAFRKNNLAFYGLESEQLQNGILVEGYEGLEEPWTGCHFVANNVKRLVDLSTGWCETHPHTGKQKTPTEPDPKIMAKIFDELPALIEVMLSTAREYARWGQAQPESQTKERAASFAKLYSEARYTLTTGLAGLEKWEDAARIAERHDSLDALAVILLDHIEVLEAARNEPNVSSVEIQTLKTTRSAKMTKLEDCFAEYGEDFAFPAYAHLLESHGVDAVLGFELDREGYKTKFLRSRPELARISWIHDVLQERDVDHAAQTLLDLAFTKEQQVWNKKVELSLGKLALLAEQGAQSNGDFRVNADEARKEQRLKEVDQELVAIKIQQSLYNAVSRCTYAAVDEKAAFEFVMDTHGKEIPNRQKAVNHIFSDGVKRLLNHEVLDAMTLIDLLTLLRLDDSSSELIFNQFWLALKVADSICHTDEVKEAKRLIWRRAFLRDDWAKVNNTQNKSDRDIVEAVADTEVFGLLVACIERRKSTHSIHVSPDQFAHNTAEDKNSPFVPMQPQEALGAFSEAPDRRFRDFSDDSFKNKYLENMRWEDKQLQAHMDKRRLGSWLQATFEEAKTQVRLDADEATWEGAQGAEANGDLTNGA